MTSTFMSNIWYIQFSNFVARSAPRSTRTNHKGLVAVKTFFCHYRKDLPDMQPVYAIPKHHHLDAGLRLPVSHNSLLQSFKSGNIRLCMCILLGFLAYHALIWATQDLLVLLVVLHKLHSCQTCCALQNISRYLINGSTPDEMWVETTSQRALTDLLIWNSLHVWTQLHILDSNLDHILCQSGLTVYIHDRSLKRLSEGDILVLGV